MLGRKQEIFLKLNQVTDALVLLLAGLAAFLVRRWLGTVGLEKIDSLPSFYLNIALVLVCTPLLLELLGYYKHPLQKTWVKSAQKLLQAGVCVVLFMGVLALFLKFNVQARLFVPIHFGIGLTMLLAKDTLVRRYFKRRGLAKTEREPIILAGRPEEVERMRAAMPTEFHSETQLIAEFDFTCQPLHELAALLTKHNVERVFLSTRNASFTQIEEVVSTCEVQGVEAWLNTSFVETSIARPTFDSLGGRPHLVFRSTPDVQWALAVKWVLDKLGAMVGITLMLPIWIGIAIGIKITSPKGAVFFKQKRSGKYGKPFVMYKFRTMVPDAEAKQKELLDQNQMSGPVFKIDHDPRIFAFGSFLRRTSLDETPQFLNVLLGEMSLVGPRPLPAYEAANVADARQRRRFSVKPGLTCLWQISGRNDITDFDDWCRLDLEYIDNWSIWADIRIILLTIPVFFGGKGAK